MNRIEGTLHLCTRSLAFEPNEMTKPLIKIKYSNFFVQKKYEKIERNALRMSLQPQVNIIKSSNK